MTRRWLTSMLLVPLVASALYLMACREPAPYALKVTFSGLVAFVKQPSSDHKKYWLWALLPAADDPKMANIPEQAEYVPSRMYSNKYPLPVHQAFLKIPAKYLYALGGCSDSSQCRNLAEAPVFIALHSHNALAPTTEKNDFEGHDIELSATQDPGVDLQGLYDIPHLKDAHQNHAKVCQGCLDQVPSESARRQLAARIMFKSGSLKAIDPVPHSTKKIPFGFYTGLGDRANCVKEICGPNPAFDNIPQRVVFTLPNLSGPLSISLRSFIGPKESRQTFIVRPPDGEDHVDIEIVNVPGDAVLNRIELTKLRANDKLEHLNLFYLISKGLKDGPFLFPVGLNGFGGQPYCGHVQLNPY